MRVKLRMTTTMRWTMHEDMLFFGCLAFQESVSVQIMRLNRYPLCDFQVSDLVLATTIIRCTFCLECAFHCVLGWAVALHTYQLLGNTRSSSSVKSTS